MSYISQSLSSSILGDSLPEAGSPIEESAPLAASVVLQKAHVPFEEPDLSSKIALRFQPIGSAPAIFPASYKVAGSQTIASISKYLVRRLRLGTVNIYVLSSFQPTPDETLHDLHAQFKTQDELVLSYSEEIAFG